MRSSLQKLLPSCVLLLKSSATASTRIVYAGRFGFSTSSFTKFQPRLLNSAVSRSAFSTKTVNVPSMGDSITEGEVHQMLKKVGDFVDLDEIVCSVETDKTQVPIRSPEAGIITELFAAEGQSVEVGKPFFVLDTAGKKPEGAAKPAAAAAAKPAAAAASEAPKAASSAPAASAPAAKKADAPKAASAAKATELNIQWGEKNRTERREPLSRMRQRIAERLKDSQNTYALLTTFQEVDMGAAMEIRNRLQADFQKKHGVKLGFMSFFVKAATAALQQQPIVNAVIDGKEIVYKNYVDISVAVATPTGLMVPVLRNTENLSFAGVEKELIRLGNKGKEGSISVEDMAGGTFTISNGGVFGSLFGTPILNPPQSAILGMHSIVNRPVVKNDQIVARPMMYLALTYDHRLVDGREAVTFLKTIKDEIEDPTRLLLQL